MTWKETVTSMSGHVFPGLSYNVDRKFQGSQMMSNLTLQMALYFNVYFVPVWAVLIILFVNEMYDYYGQLYKFIIITVISTVFFVELLRLYFGFKGNLEDKIPELAGFWMLSILLQLPLQAFLLFNSHFMFDVLQVVTQSLMTAMILIQLVSGYCALKYTAEKQATYFRVMKLSSDITLADIEKKYRVK